MFLRTLEGGGDFSHNNCGRDLLVPPLSVSSIRCRPLRRVQVWVFGLGTGQRPLAQAHPEAMGEGVMRSCLQRPSPLQGDPSVISWKDLSFQPCLLTPSQLPSFGCSHKQQPARSCQISTCLPSALLCSCFEFLPWGPGACLTT